MNEDEARKLARYRVGEERHMGKSMNVEEIIGRREYIRKMLWNIPGWHGMTDEQIDNIRIYRFDEDWYIEDIDFYEYRF